MTLHPKTKEAYQLFHNGILALSRAERAGIRIDMEKVEREQQILTRKIAKLEDRFRQTKFYRHWEHSMNGKVNINSNHQLSIFLYKIKKIKPEKITESGQGSTDDEALRTLNLPELDDLLEIRKLKKIRDTYLNSFTREQVDGYVHPVFNLHLVKTYRSSSDSPNFQNIPAKDEEAMSICRKVLFPRPGHILLEADFKSIEVAMSACYNHDTQLIHYLKNPSSDMHADMAKQIFLLDTFDKSEKSNKLLRIATKNGFVFPEFYGDYFGNCAINMACRWCGLPQGTWTTGQGVEIVQGGKQVYLSDHFISKGIKSFAAFTKHIEKVENDFWGRRFAEYAEWKNRWWSVYQKHGYIDLLTGFRCQGVMSYNDITNYPIQGTAFHCLLWSIIEIDQIMRQEQWDSKLIGQIHDSMIFDVHPDEFPHVCDIIRKVTCEWLPKTWSWINVPLYVELEAAPVDGSWMEKEKV